MFLKDTIRIVSRCGNKGSCRGAEIEEKKGATQRGTPHLRKENYIKGWSFQDKSSLCTVYKHRIV